MKAILLTELESATLAAITRLRDTAEVSLSDARTALACLERAIPPFHYMVAVAGGDTVPCVPYATFGSQALSNAVVEALRHRRAALLAHHGMVCHAADLDGVLALAMEVETLARMYLMALAVAEPPLLSPAQMAEVLARFVDYRP